MWNLSLPYNWCDKYEETQENPLEHKNHELHLLQLQVWYRGENKASYQTETRNQYELINLDLSLQLFEVLTVFENKSETWLV